MTDADVIAAIRRTHLKVNTKGLRLFWDRARIDPGGTIFGPGPYLHVPATIDDDEADERYEVVVRVYTTERVRRRLAAQWRRT